jgi:hypothetical protein
VAVSVALAQRIGADPIDPEVQLATQLIAGLVQVRQQSTFHHVQQATSIAALNDVIRRDILKAAQLAEPSLTAFDKHARRGEELNRTLGWDCAPIERATRKPDQLAGVVSATAQPAKHLGPARIPRPKGSCGAEQVSR